MAPALVTLVGLGPGAADLLTRRAADRLAAADVLLAAIAPDPAVLALAPAGVEVVLHGARPQFPAWAPGEVDEWAIARARAGRRVVRLYPGDPGEHPSWAATVRALLTAGIPCEVVPGLGPGPSALTLAGVSTAEPETAGPVVLLDATTLAPGRWVEIAGWPEATLVITAAETRLALIGHELIRHGREPTTPVLLVSAAGRPSQEQRAETLGSMGALELPGPVVAVVGEPARPRRLLRWSTPRPLAGQRVAVARVEGGGGEGWRGALEAEGAHVLDLLLATVQPAAAGEVTAEVLAEIGAYDWILFGSPAGVRGFFGQFLRCFQDLRALGLARLAAAGPGTAEALAQYHLRADLRVEAGGAEALVGALQGEGSLDNLRLLVISGTRGRDALVKRLEQERAIVDQLTAYELRPVDAAAHPAVRSFRAEGADVLILAGPAAARAFCERVGELAPPVPDRRPRVFAAGEMAEATLREFRLSGESLPETPEAGVPTIVRRLSEPTDAG